MCNIISINRSTHIQKLLAIHVVKFKNNYMISIDPKIKKRATWGKNHEITSDLRGHKNKCRFQDCTCWKCQLLVRQQRVTAEKVANFRKKAKEHGENDGETG